MILVGAFWNAVVPGRNPANLQRISVPFNHQQITRLQCSASELAFCQTDELRLSKVKSTAMHICYPQIGPLER